MIETHISEASQPPKGGSQKHPPLYMVEDDAELRTLMSDVLAIEGFTSCMMASGAELLDHLKTAHDVKVILLDLNLPVMSGAEVLQHLNARQDRKSFKVILLSGWDDLEKKSNELGADGWIQKPVDILALGEMLEILFSEM